MNCLKLTITLLFASTMSLFAQDPNILWQKIYYETSNYERLEEILQTSDLGHMMGGNKILYSGGPNYNMRITKLDPQGQIDWENLYGDLEFLKDIKQTSDQGYIFGGYKVINENNITSYRIYKVDENGSTLWDKTIGGDRWDELSSIEQTNDGGYILGGYSYSNISGDKTEDSRGESDYWIIKLDAAGNMEWQKTIGGSQFDLLKKISQTSDNGYIVAGTSDSPISGEKTENTRGGIDYWILKLDSMGNIQWQKTLGGNSADDLADMIVTSEGGYLLTGSSKSNISGEKSENSEGSNDYWIVKLNSIGDIEWQNTIGGADEDIATSIKQTLDNGYLIGGHSKSDISGKKTESSQGGEDYWIVKLNTNGSIAWQNTIGGDKPDILSSVCENTDGSIILGGSSNSGISGDKNVGQSSITESYWIINHAATLDIQDFTTQSKITIFPNPVQSLLTIETSGDLIEMAEIYDINGRLISEFKNIENHSSIDLSRLKSGIYFIKFANSAQTIMKKIIKD